MPINAGRYVHPALSQDCPEHSAPPAYWEVWHRTECVAHLATFDSAVTACRNDSGRSLTIYDPEGRIVTCYRDGREVT